MQRAPLERKRTTIVVGLVVLTVAVVARSGQTTAYQYDAAGNLIRVADVSSDVNNCGAIGAVCSPNNACCIGTCTDLSSSPANCGACGVTCSAPANASATCLSSTCGYACLAGYCPN